MAIRDALASLFAPRPQVQQIEWLGSSFREMILGLTPEELYRTQPHLRIVLSFVARNVAHLGLPVFQRVSDTNRKRLRDDPVARLLSRPNATMTRFELIESLVSDLGLYDIAYWLVTEDAKARFREALERKKQQSHRTADGVAQRGREVRARLG